MRVRLGGWLFCGVIATLSIPPGLALAAPQTPRGHSRSPARNPAASASRVAHVTVFLDRARTVRSQTVAAEAGMREIVFSGLPINLDPESVRCEGHGLARAAIAGIELRTVQLGAPSENRTRDLERRLRNLDDRDKDLEAEEHTSGLARVTYRDAITEGTKALGKSLATRSFDLRLWGEAFAFAQAQYMRFTRDMLRIERARREVSEHEDLLRRQLEGLRGYQARSFREVRVSLDVSRRGDLEVLLTYDVPGAAWVPAYDIVLDPDLGRATLSYRAHVTQRTGEDWHEVKATLSTGRPDVGAAAPEPQAWVLGALPLGDKERAKGKSGSGSRGDLAGAPPGPAKRMKQSLAPAPEAASQEDQPAEPADEEADQPIETLEAEIKAKGTAIQFEAARAVTLLGDGRPQQVPIGERTLTASASYRVLPRLSPHAYLTAQFVNSTPWPLLPGTIRSHLGLDFAGKFVLQDDVAPNSPFSAQFGADRQIKVSRNIVRKMVGARGFVVNRKHHAEYFFRVVLHNKKTVPIHLEVVEPVPVSNREDILVTFLGAAAGQKDTFTDGRLTWKLTLPPGKHHEINWGYEVDWPEGVALRGLE